MAKKSLTTLLPSTSKDKTPVQLIPPNIQSPQTRLRMNFSNLLVLGILVISIVTGATGNCLKTLHLSVGTAPTPVPITTLNVQRTASYAGLEYTVINAQYATSFSDDGIQAGAA